MRRAVRQAIPDGAERARALDIVRDAFRTAVLPSVLWCFDVLGIPQRVVAGAVGVRVQTLNDWRTGKRPIPRQRRIMLVAHVEALRIAVARFHHERPSAYTATCRIALDAVVREALTPDIAADVTALTRELLAAQRPLVDALLRELRGGDV